MGFNLKNIISIRDFKKSDINYILELSKNMEEQINNKIINKNQEGKLLGILFYEPSTRTRLSFETAMKRLSGNTVGFSQAESTSTKKGEVLHDTAQVIAQYTDAIVLRHKKEGAARYISEVTDIPVINAGDGAGQHPTQTLLDLYTIKNIKDGFKNLKIAIVGDLKYGRTVHSLVYALAMFNTEIIFISPNELRMPEEILNDLRKTRCKFSVSNNIENIINEVDIIYMTRIQKERFPDPKEYSKIKGQYNINKKMIEDTDVMVMHPLPRVDEISFNMDNTKNAKYFQQAFYGVPVRMALLDSIID
ncbi:MAG: aspartate carbamoyltransferase [Methanobacteriaceae archaeon]|nr:aspartate carbamoyltransferase [Methanobacteriaceae archaeon]